MKKILLIILLLILFSCSNNGKKSDAYGNFETTEIIVSAEATGKLLWFSLDEGIILKSGVVAGVVDTMQLYLKKLQLDASRQAINTKFASVISQVKVLNQQKENASKDKDRIINMFKSKAATQKQVDDINGAISVIDKQISQIETQNPSITNEVKSLNAQIAQLEDLIKKSIIANPIDGTVLNKYAETGEVVIQGKPLYKIADLKTMILRVYVSGSQLSAIKIGQKVKVLIDKNEKEFTTLDGSISWISSQSEFTPKIIQTKDERVNMVYAVKVLVKNDGTLKIGMPGEVKF